MSDSDTTFWKARSEHYQELQWVRDDKFMERFIDNARLEPNHHVLDIGTGTGNVANAVRPMVQSVIGIDISPDMTRETRGEVILMDARDLQFEDATFDRVLARMVLHHITDGIDKAIAEAVRVLKPGGLFVVGEGTPPRAEDNDYHLQPEIDEWYTETFKLKEDRLTFDEYDIVDMMAEAGLRKIGIDIYNIERLSVGNWLENAGLLPIKRKQIWARYLNPPYPVERAYHLDRRFDSGGNITDCFILCRHVMVTGKKPELPGYDSRDYKLNLDQLKRKLPQLFDKPGKLLYIGASHRTECLSELREVGHDITVLEIWPPNCWLLTSDPRIDYIVCGDVVRVADLDLPHQHYDVAFWWHGPEHVEAQALPPVLNRLEALADLVVLGCPNGWYEVPRRDNPHDSHFSAWYAKDFEGMGYEAESVDNRVDIPGSHLLAWRDNVSV